MNDVYIPVRKVWEFEKFLASKPDVWRNEAINLRYSMEVLFLYDKELFVLLFEKKLNRRCHVFFSARIQRLLMGFALENLSKALLLQNQKKLKEVFAKDGRLSWQKDGHDLLKLFNEAKVTTDETEKRYLELWQTCALWAGRYPLPLKEGDLPRQRRGLLSREALFKRSAKRIDLARKENDPFLGADIFDLMHSSVSDFEHECFEKLFVRCDGLLSQRNK